MAVLCRMSTIQYSAQSARLSVRLSKWAWPDDVIRSHSLRRSEIPSTGVRCRRKFGGRFLVRSVQAWGMTTNNPAVKMKTRLPTERSFGNKYPLIYNHCGVMVACSRKTLKTMFFRFLWKNDPLLEHFQNLVPKGFIAIPIDALCSNFVKFG